MLISGADLSFSNSTHSDTPIFVKIFWSSNVNTEKMGKKWKFEREF